VSSGSALSVEGTADDYAKMGEAVERSYGVPSLLKYFHRNPDLFFRSSSIVNPTIAKGRQLWATRGVAEEAAHAHRIAKGRR
jgi:hypothetical protein